MVIHTDYICKISNNAPDVSNTGLRKVNINTNRQRSIKITILILLIKVYTNPNTQTKLVVNTKINTGPKFYTSIPILLLNNEGSQLRAPINFSISLFLTSFEFFETFHTITNTTRRTRSLCTQY